MFKGVDAILVGRKKVNSMSDKKQKPLPRDCTPMGAMPLMVFEPPTMRVFSPHDPELAVPYGNNEELLTFSQAVRYNPKITFIPRVEDCMEMWQRYAMLDNIQEHSKKVGAFVKALAQAANARHIPIDEDLAFATGLLHDLGKTYCITHGGSHAQVGAAWAMAETRNALIAQGVLLHVHFPWEDKLKECLQDNRFFLILAVIYADKRVRHDEYVSINERFADLRKRYGKSKEALDRIEVSRQQGLVIEQSLSQQLGIELDAYTPDYRRLVG